MSYRQMQEIAERIAADRVRAGIPLKSATDVACEHIAEARASGLTWDCACDACRATRATMRGSSRIRARIEAAQS